MITIVFGFHLWAAYDDGGMWSLIATIAGVAAVLGALACRVVFGRLSAAEAPAT